MIEGHVPVAEVNRLLEEKPDVAGLTVLGMPIGSPGMEVDGMAADVISFGNDGSMELFASYQP